ncbi:MAG: flavodoxin [Ruminococcaceae bacterium]|nr:flavodoxin [Oscillospiraceae bacterium]
MSKVAVVFWSGTGNTEKMAEAVADGIKGKGAEFEIVSPSAFTPAKMDEFDAVAFGCPSMGNEQLEDSEFEPMFTAIESKLSGKKIALFGSYGWGDGEWMRNWNDQCVKDGAQMACDFVICNGEPDEKALEDCKALGAALS